MKKRVLEKSLHGEENVGSSSNSSEGKERKKVHREFCLKVESGNNYSENYIWGETKATEEATPRVKMEKGSEKTEINTNTSTSSAGLHKKITKNIRDWE